MIIKIFKLLKNNEMMFNLTTVHMNAITNSNYILNFSDSSSK